MIDSEVFRRIGSTSQLVSVTPVCLTDGKAAGVRCISIEGASGLSALLVQDRAMDIAQLRYRGTNISYMTANGISSPGLYGASDQRFDTNPFLGMMTTCGLDNTGPACTDEGREYYQHGRLSNTPAENVTISTSFDGEDASVCVECDIRIYQLGNYNFRLHRKIVFNDADRTIKIDDRVINESGKQQQVCLMYHCNFGYPFLDENAVIEIPSLSRRYKGNEDAPVDTDEILTIPAPSPDWKPQVIYHSFPSSGMNTVRIVNNDRHMTAELSFSGESLPFLNQWRMFRDREYVLSLEPCNAVPYGRHGQKERNCAQYIDPYGMKDYHLELRII